jgi:hypothetical protein
MCNLINFDHWTVDEDSPFGSGASEKKWLINSETKQKGIFKFPKGVDIGKPTGEYWAEKVASQLAEVLGIECAKVDIGTFRGRVGSMSYMILKEEEELIEGVQYITNIYKEYNQDKFIDYRTEEPYSVIKAYENSAISTAVDIWNQLTEYTRNKILDAIEKLDTNRDTMNWYDFIDREGKYHSRFVTEFENCSKNPISQLMYLMKNGKQFNLTYINQEGTKATLCDCEIIEYLIDSHKLTVKNTEGTYEIVDEKIIEIDII